LQIGKCALTATISSLLLAGLTHLSKIKCFFRVRWGFFKLAGLLWHKCRARDGIKIRILAVVTEFFMLQNLAFSFPVKSYCLLKEKLL